jgi:aminoglycoside 6'-N-acetyltransferase
VDNIISFRALQREDLSLVQQWLNQPHVLEWWHTPMSLEDVHAKYDPRIDGTEPTHVFLIHYDGRPVGLIQWYRWSNYMEHAQLLGAKPEYAGIDLAIGERDMTGRGVGTAAIRQFVDEIVFAETAIAAIVSDPEEKNTRSLRAFTRAGFIVARTTQHPGEDLRRSIVFLGRPESKNENV